jgi:tRNA U34 5-methylaminomethyl-2-thiouridine-forming methyltransferase MnmC
METEIRLTEDGSHTLHVPGIDECYHSTHGAIQESIHIFINEGLKTFLSASDQSINVLEIGFGTGLNAFLTLMEAGRLKRRVHYTTLELSPLAVDHALLLNYPEMLGGDRYLFEEIHQTPWDEVTEITPYFTVQKVNADFTGYKLPGWYDVIYFDAFSPEKQPEMWSEERFADIYEHSAGGAVLTTYCAKGAVRRAMQSAGFIVERLPGPPGKREILRGRKVYPKKNGL